MISALVVDDNNTVCRMVGWLLRNEGLRVVECGNVPTALAWLGREHFDYVVTEYLVGSTTGYALVSRVCKVSRSTRCALMTGSLMHIPSSILKRVDCVIEKPNIVSGLLDLIGGPPTLRR